MASRNGVALMDRLIRVEALQMERDIKESMQGQGSGVIYVRQGKEHQASAPGEPPARDTGNLAANVRAIRLGPHTMRVVSGAEYSAHLEYGTIKMEPRPFMAPAVEKCRTRLGRVTLPSELLVSGPVRV